MDYNIILTLLNKYFEGNTSLAEEQMLHKYFLQTENIASELLYAKEMFLHFSNEKNIQYIKPITIKVSNTHNKQLIRIISLAASIAILIGVLFFVNRKPTEETVYAYINGAPITNMDSALIQTKKALFLISNNFNQGTRELNQISKFNEIEQQLIKTK
jgi:hypothetical protein